MELDEEDLFEGGDAVGVEGEELVVPHEAGVRPEEREGGGEKEEEGRREAVDLGSMRGPAVWSRDEEIPRELLKRSEAEC